MVRALLLALMWTTVISNVNGTHYGEYTAAKMPNYGSQDYHESAKESISAVGDYHYGSPIAPASFDYKYEEEKNFKTNNIAKENNRRNQFKKLPRHHRTKYLNVGQLDKYKPDRKSTIHKLTVRRRSNFRNDEKIQENNKLPLRSGRIRSNDIIDKEDDYIEDGRYQDHFDNRYIKGTTERVIRRKVRDKSLTPIPVENEEGDEDDEEEGKEGDDAKDSEYTETEETVSPIGRAGAHEQVANIAKEDNEEVQERPTLPTDDELIARLEAKKLDQKKQEDYNDYYDMQRLNNIKKKITILYRRTKARVAGTTTSRRYKTWTYRRSYVLDRHPSTSHADYRETKAKIKIKTKKRTKSTSKTKSKTATTVTRTTLTSTVSTRPTTITTQMTTVPSTALPTPNTTVPTTSTLSMAERSRLSILKKVLLKESLNQRALAKPPVLLKVTSESNRRVDNIEPPSNVSFARLVGVTPTDSPKRIARIKKYMRNRLIANARNINDLMEDWNEEVCEVVDLAHLYAARKCRVCNTLFTLVLLLQFM